VVVEIKSAIQNQTEFGTKIYIGNTLENIGKVRERLTNSDDQTRLDRISSQIEQLQTEAKK
jgi:methyl coenzyme M reductase subunit C-like uncharacterized protein (methanogenesis marker protein 7)